MLRAMLRCDVMQSGHLCATSVHSALHSPSHVLDNLAEEVPEQARQQGAPQIQALVGVMIPVVLISPAQRHLAPGNPDSETHI